MASFRLVGSPKRKAYKPRKRPSVSEGKPIYFLHRIGLSVITKIYVNVSPEIVATDSVLAPGTITPRSVAQRLQAKFPCIPSFTLVDDTTCWLVFCSPVKMVNPVRAPYSNPRVVVELTATSGYFHLEAHFQRFNLEGNEAQLHSLIMSLQGYVLCPGLPSSLARSMTFGSKKLHRWGPLLQRSDYADCLMWHVASHAASSSMCPKCCRLSYHLQDMISSISPVTRQKRIAAGSRYPKVYLTPRSVAERIKNEKVQAVADKKAAKKLQRLDIDVDNITNRNLIAVVAELEHSSKDTLKQLLLEADLAGID